MPIDEKHQKNAVSREDMEQGGKAASLNMKSLQHLSIYICKFPNIFQLYHKKSCFNRRNLLPPATIPLFYFFLLMVGRSCFPSKPKLHNSPSNSAVKAAPSSQWIKLSCTPDQPVIAAKCCIYISKLKSVPNTFLWGVLTLYIYC